MQRTPLQDGSTPLHLAAAGCHEGAMRGLLEAGADKEATNGVSCAAGLSGAIS
jgi:ankyrin repeat protein